MAKMPPMLLGPVAIEAFTAAVVAIGARRFGVDEEGDHGVD
jgi:hypothetical protein